MKRQIGIFFILFIFFISLLFSTMSLSGEKSFAKNFEIHLESKPQGIFQESAY